MQIRCKKLCSLTAGGLYDMNIENFGIVSLLFSIIIQTGTGKIQINLFILYYKQHVKEFYHIVSFRILLN